MDDDTLDKIDRARLDQAVEKWHEEWVKAIKKIYDLLDEMTELSNKERRQDESNKKTPKSH